MFTILGADGKEYGPVSLDQVKAWISEGRSNLDTKAKRVGEEIWKRLGDFPEFGGAAAVLPPPPFAAPTPAPRPTGATGSVDPKTYADQLIARAPKLDIGSCVSRSFALLKNDLWLIVGATAVALISMWIMCMIPKLGTVAGLLLTGVFYGGIYHFYLKKIRDQPTEFSDIFAGFNLAFVPLMLAGLVITVLVIIGLFCLLLPGIYLAVSYVFTYLLIVDKKLDFWPAMEVSRRVVTSQWLMVFLLILVGVAICMLGAFALFVGIFFAAPIAIGAIAYAYEDLVNPPAGSAITPLST
jgi:hypothetical protein